METLVIVITANWLKLQGQHGLSFTCKYRHTHRHRLSHKNITIDVIIFNAETILSFMRRTEIKSQPGNPISQTLPHVHLQNHIRVDSA